MILNQQTAEGKRAEKKVGLLIEGDSVPLSKEELCMGLAWTALRISKEKGIAPPMTTKTLYNMRQGRGGEKAMRQTADFVGLEMPQKVYGKAGFGG